MKIFGLILIATFFVATSCTKQKGFLADFNTTNDRIWVGKDFWSIPLEDWKVEDGKLFCVGGISDSRVHLLTHVLAPDAGDFQVSTKIMLNEKGNVPGSAGLIIGAYDDEDSSAKAACYFGKGIKAGVSLNGYAFIKDKKLDLPKEFDYSEFIVSVSGNNNKLKMNISDKNGAKIKELSCDVDGIQGLVAVGNNFDFGKKEKPGNSKFSFDELSLSGSKVVEKPDNSFGPILWTMYTLSKETVKLMALLPPLGADDNQDVTLQLKKGSEWETIATQSIEADSRTAIFKLEKWEETKAVNYRVQYVEKGKYGTETLNYYEGIIRKNPVDKPLKLGGLTCQFHFGFPYTPLVNNLTTLNPDMLYFSGDQIYEGNGGYGIKREPTDVSIVNYLGKYYMFGWAFGSLMRDRPTVCTPDDHDVFHGNLWGEAGIAKPGGAGSSDTRGFMQSVEMVNAVNRTQCGQLPDPYDATPAERGMTVWYTDINYGRVSFAVVSDRIYKTGPEAVSDWEGRHDHMKDLRKDLSFLDKDGVKMLGDRQLKFLNDWKMDWKGADMKVLLSQTVFANVATHHGNYYGYLYGDLDSGGWPRSGRNKAIKIMRQVGAFQVSGDQHVPSLVQYGIEEYRDANWCFCTPAIAVMYLRWFRADEMGYPVLDRPEHAYPNTGKYTDAFGNKNYVYAIGNPGKNTIDRDSRYSHAQIRSSGFGMIKFDQTERTIDIDAWRFLADVENPNHVKDQFPGWQKQITQFDNLGKGAKNILPEISVNKPNQLIQIVDVKTGELVYIFRMKGDKIQPKVFNSGTYSICIGEKEVGNFVSQEGSNSEKISLEL